LAQGLICLSAHCIIAFHFSAKLPFGPLQSAF